MALFDAAMVGVGRVEGFAALGVGIGEEGLGDLRLGSHGVDSDQRPGQLQPLQEERISLDFSSTASWPSTSRWPLAAGGWRLAQADTMCSGARPLLRSWPRREVLPSIAIRSGSSSRKSSTQAMKQALNTCGSMALITSFNVSCEATPRS